ncbi:MAG: nitrilase-related carbon-nitrogen hydrolase [Dehalococcoidia bacterium]
MADGYWAAVVQAPVEVITDPARRDEIIAANRERAMRAIEAILATSAQPPKLFQFPVLMLQGAYNEARSPEARLAVSFELPGPEVQPLLEFCARHDIVIASSCVERHAALPGWFFHSGMVLGPNGLLIRYPKAQARSAAGVRIIKDHIDEYAAIFGRDAVFPVVDSPLGKLATCVEAEIMVPEVARSFAAKGAEVLLHPTVERTTHHPWVYQPVKIARAVENRLYVVSANIGVARMRHPVTGELEEGRTAGGSAVIGPDGVVRCSVGGSGEGWASAYIDLAALREERSTPAPDVAYTPALYRDLYGGAR